MIYRYIDIIFTRNCLFCQYQYQDHYEYHFYEKLSLASIPRFFFASAAVNPLEFACNHHQDEDDDEVGDEDYYDDAGGRFQLDDSYIINQN